MSRATLPTLTAIAALVLAGCTGNNGQDKPSDPTTAPSPSQTQSSPTDTPSPSTSSDLEDPGEKKAAQKLIEAKKLYNKIAATEGDIAKIHTVARSQAANQWSYNLAMLRSKRYTYEGASKVEVQNVDKVAGKKEYIVTACIDSSGVKVTDKNGKSVAEPGAPDRVTGEFRVQDFGKDGYFITEDSPEVSEC